MKYFYFLFFCLVLAPMSLLSNNLQISGVTATTTTVTFNVQWDNSWNIDNLSRDAVWIFVKVQDCTSANKSWDHLNLSTSSEDHSVTGGLLQVDAVTDGKGVFIYRSAFGGGNNPSASVTLTFATPIASPLTSVNFDVMGIEMVYVPQGSFIAGDNNSTRPFGTNGTTAPQTITSEAGIAANGLCGSDENTGDWNNGGSHPAIPAAFPKGYNAFYCMKYEITQDQYCHFLNLLPAAQQAIRCAIAPTSASKTEAMGTITVGNCYRNYIQINTPASGGPPLNPAVFGMNRNNNSTFDEVDDGGDIACAFLSWNDLLAYLDWSALRPMTELEYEKACRGPASAGPFPDQMYAWGSINLTQADNQYENAGYITNPGRPTEIAVAVGDGLASFNMNNSVQGPWRVGFAAKSGSSRAQAGATYYGIMEMSSNVAEQCYHIGRVQTTFNYLPGTLSATFDGALGDGVLDANAESNQASWENAGLVDYQQSILRGGGFATGTGQMRVSDRTYLYPYMNYNGPQTNNRVYWVGGRGVRQF